MVKSAQNDHDHILGVLSLQTRESVTPYIDMAEHKDPFYYRYNFNITSFCPSGTPHAIYTLRLKCNTYSLLVISCCLLKTGSIHTYSSGTPHIGTVRILFFQYSKMDRISSIVKLVTKLYNIG